MRAQETSVRVKCTVVILLVQSNFGNRGVLSTRAGSRSRLRTAPPERTASLSACRGRPSTAAPCPTCCASAGPPHPPLPWEPPPPRPAPAPPPSDHAGARRRLSVPPRPGPAKLRFHSPARAARTEPTTLSAEAPEVPALRTLRPDGWSEAREVRAQHHHPPTPPSPSGCFLPRTPRHGISRLSQHGCAAGAVHPRAQRTSQRTSRA